MAISSFSCAFSRGDDAVFMAGTNASKAVTIDCVQIFGTGDVYGYWCYYTDDVGVKHRLFAWPDDLSV